jgi:hypothetical protein
MTKLSALASVGSALRGSLERRQLYGLTVYLTTTVSDTAYLIGVLANWIVLPLVSYLILDVWVFRTPKLCQEIIDSQDLDRDRSAEI